ncbi:unnamed protein product, partial [Darwinula stevensoni]
VLDISWSNDGLQVMACSWDGTVACMELLQNEIGKPLSIDECSQVLEKRYGRRMNGGKAAVNIIEHPGLLEAKDKEDEARQKEKEAKRWHPDPDKNSSSSTATIIRGPTDRQIETVTADGKRRITPIFIPLTIENSEKMQTFGKAGLQSSSDAQKSKIVIEKRGENSMDSPSKTSGGVEDGERGVISIKAPVAPSPPPLSSEVVSITKAPTKRGRPPAAEKERESERPPKSPPAPEVACPRPASPSTAPQSSLPTIAATSIQKLSLTRSSLTSIDVLPLPKAQKTLVTSVPKEWRAEVENWVYSSGDRSLHKLRGVRFGDLSPSPSTSWEVLFDSPILLLSATAEMCAVSCENGSLHVFSSHGSRLCPPLAILGPASKMTSSGWLLLVITTPGVVHMWDFDTCTPVIHSEAITHLIRGRGICVHAISIDQQHSPVVSLSNGRAYAYDLHLKTW